MTPSVEVLPWDSAFFGAPIGRVGLDGAGPEDLAEIDAMARELGLACVYGSLDPVDAEATVHVQRAGWLFVEAATTFTLRPDEPEIPLAPGVSIRLATPADLAGLEPAIASLAPWSRYAVDPRFGLDAAMRLQRAWLERAASEEDHDRELVVAERDESIVALITRCSTPAPVVDGVWASLRGSGAARQLIQDSRGWAGAGRLLGGPIAARNVLALRYVSYCGYRVASVKYLYHRWLD